MKRLQFMMIRATEEEKKIATSKARDMGMNLSAFIRFLIRQWDETETSNLPTSAPQPLQNQRESRLWVIPEFLCALYLKIRK